MLSAALLRLLRLDRLRRRAGVDDRAVVASFSARFVDETLSGAWTVLLPTFRRVFGLSLVQVGLLVQVVDWVALGVEPVAASSVDLVSRRRLMVGGAVAIAASVALMGAAPTFPVLLVGFALYGVGGGPLTHTADIVVVEAFPSDAERAYGRATMVDTGGALLGPAAVAAAAALGMSWRLVLLALAGLALGHALLTSTAALPGPPRARTAGSGARAWIDGARAAVADRSIRRALLLLLAFDLFESAFVLKYIWLRDEVGLSEAGVASWAALEQLVDIAALVLLDRWLVRRPGRVVLRTAAAALVVVAPAWVLAPGLGGRVVLAIPLAMGSAVLWPIAKAQLLTVDPNLAGAAQAITTLFPVVPLALLQAVAANAVGTGAAMAGTAAMASLLLVGLGGGPLRSRASPP